MTSAVPGSSPPGGPFARRGLRRTGIAAVVLVAWVAGLALLARRELFVGDAQRLVEAAMRLSPGATYFVVEQDGAQIGFASTTLDTTNAGIDVEDYFLADLNVAGTNHRASARSMVRLSRGLALKTFDVRVDAPGSRIVAG